MPEIGPEHPLTYRHEVVAPLFERIRAGESCAIVGPSSMGKSRLTQFVMRPDVQVYQLNEHVAATHLILADCNRLAGVSEWGFFELLLTALVEACGRSAAMAPLRMEINSLRREAIVSREPLLARRHVELAVQMLCQEQGQTLCLFLDEFDETYRRLPAPALANLRALRDANKYQLCFALMLREHPARLRNPDECEGFYELFSRSIFGLGPYAGDDACRVVEQITVRRGKALTEAARAQFLQLSGGHPGLITALFDTLPEQNGDTIHDWPEWCTQQPAIREECRKLWGGLAEDERLALSQLVHGVAVDKTLRDVLLLKGLLRQGDGRALFSPLFTRFVLTEATPVDQVLWVDQKARIVRLDNRPITDLTAREFDLLAYLWQHAGHVCTRDGILAELYPVETHQNDDLLDSRVDTLIKRLREKIEPVRQNPRYILTVRGKGYKLVNGEREAVR
jgi:DNA-binding winged helix-turn-helix (wHTH) protein